MSERVVQNLNRALHTLLAESPRAWVVGEDIEDPYGGAFGVTRGLSTAWPGRVLGTPLSETGLMGVGVGLALRGQRVVVEIMFGDFMFHGLDLLVNFACKAVTMYGQPLELDLLVRCPVGGHRGYGPTHSQCPQKHLIGFPNLDLYELTPFHDAVPLLSRLTALGHPAVLFEDKRLYTQVRPEGGRVDDLFSYELVGPRDAVARVFCPDFSPSVAIVCGGGSALPAIAAARRLFVEHEIECEIVIPVRLFPLEEATVLPLLAAADHVFVVEEGSEGGQWGAEVARVVRARPPVRSLASARRTIPAAPSLERGVLLQIDDIVDQIAREVKCAHRRPPFDPQ